MYCVSVPEAIKGMIESIKRADERHALANKLGVALEELDCMDDMYNNQFHTYEIFQQLAEFCDELAAKEENISSLKKQIKYCKNPMKKKQLEKDLNEAYKRRK